MTDLPRLREQAARLGVSLTDEMVDLLAGYRDLLLFAPPVQSSISLEPQTHMPGGASLPEGHPDGLVGLAPGAPLRATAVIRLVPPS